MNWLRFGRPISKPDMRGHRTKNPRARTRRLLPVEQFEIVEENLLAWPPTWIVRLNGRAIGKAASAVEAEEMVQRVMKRGHVTAHRRRSPHPCYYFSWPSSASRVKW